MPTWREMLTPNSIEVALTDAHVVVSRLSTGVAATVVEKGFGSSTRRFKVSKFRGSPTDLEFALFHEQLARPVCLWTERENKRYPNSSHLGHWIYANIIWMPHWRKPDWRMNSAQLLDEEMIPRIKGLEAAATARGELPPVADRNGIRMNTAPRRKSIPRDVQQAVFARDGGRCVICGSTRDLQFDHVIPWSLGGSDSAENLQVLCASCNASKGGGF